MSLPFPPPGFGEKKGGKKAQGPTFAFLKSASARAFKVAGSEMHCELGVGGGEVCGFSLSAKGE